MTNNKILEIEKEELKGKKIPKIKSGDIIRIIQVYKEKDKERHSVFEGMVIAVNSGSGTRCSITVRRVIDGVGVEKIIPLYLSNISKIEVLKSSKTRRAKLYYLRNLSGKKARLKEKGLDKEVIEMMAIEEKVSKEPKKEEIKDEKEKPSFAKATEGKNDSKEHQPKAGQPRAEKAKDKSEEK